MSLSFYDFIPKYLCKHGVSAIKYEIQNKCYYKMIRKHGTKTAHIVLPSGIRLNKTWNDKKEIWNRNLRRKVEMKYYILYYKKWKHKSYIFSLL